MNTATALGHVSVDDYLAGEESATIRHEYVAGEVYAMSGASEEHNLILINLLTSFRSHLRGKGCRLYGMDLKARIESAGQDIFYYPDLMVVCDPRDNDRFFKRYPKLVIEVLSPSTSRLDRFEKRMHYQQIETLEEYVLVQQDFAEVAIFRRSNEWQLELIRGMESEVAFRSIGFTMPMAAIYEGVR